MESAYKQQMRVSIPIAATGVWNGTAASVLRPRFVYLAAETDNLEQEGRCALKR